MVILVVNSICDEATGHPDLFAKRKVRWEMSKNALKKVAQCLVDVAPTEVVKAPVTLDCGDRRVVRVQCIITDQKSMYGGVRAGRNCRGIVQV